MPLITKRMFDKVLKSPVSIKMTTEIDDEGQKDINVIEQKGQLYEKDDTTVLTFSENNEHGERTDSLITIYSDRVSVKRSGAVSMLQKFQNDKVTETSYRHQFGTIQMTTETDEIIYTPPPLDLQEADCLFAIRQVLMVIKEGVID